jgi:glycosyltransferase domain-containing protein
MEKMDTNFKNSITLVIATKNRPFNLGAVLKYYEFLKFPYKIIIADESDSRFKKLNLQAIGNATGLDIEHYDSGFKGIFDSYLFLLKKVNTDYVINSGDDDFFNVKTIKKCIGFLHENPDYISAGGISIRVLGSWDGKKGRYNIYKKMNATTDNYISGSIASRLFNYSQRQKVITYNIVRTKPILKLYKEAKKLSFFHSLFITEFYQNAMLLAEGKNKRFLRFYHFWFMPKGGRELYSKTVRNSPDSWFDKFNDPKLSLLLLNFVKVLSKKLQNVYGFQLRTAKDLAEMILISYISKFYSRRHTESSLAQHHSLSNSYIRNKVYFYNIVFFHKFQRAASITQAFISRNVFAEFYIFFYCKFMFYFGRLKLNDSMRIIDFLNNEKNCSEKNV